MLKIMIGLRSGECITVNYYAMKDYEELIQSWEISKKMFGKKFLDISDKNNKGRIITIYMPDILFVRKDEVKGDDELD